MRAHGAQGAGAGIEATRGLLWTRIPAALIGENARGLWSRKSRPLVHIYARGCLVIGENGEVISSK